TMSPHVLVHRLFLDRQEAEGWGAKVIERLSKDLHNEFTGQQGFLPRNLKYMRAFAEGWPDAALLHQPDAKMPLAKSAIVQQPVAQLPWDTTPFCSTDSTRRRSGFGIRTPTWKSASRYRRPSPTAPGTRLSEPSRKMQRPWLQKRGLGVKT